jgi:hypothetical protein
MVVLFYYGYKHVFTLDIVGLKAQLMSGILATSAKRGNSRAEFLIYLRDIHESFNSGCVFSFFLFI